MTSAWSKLDLRRQVFVLVATVAMFAAVLLLARTATAPRMALLYAGLEPSAAGQVVTALEAQGATIDIRGSAIYVDAARRDALRLTLAGEGLPSSGVRGYEILDSLTGFGTTSQMFDAAYWRAKEGELARTISASRQIEAARVHLSNPSSSPFERGQVAGASVSITTVNSPISGAQAMALRHLIASAVSGLDAKDVTIVDSRDGLIPVGNSYGNSLAPSAQSHSDLIREKVRRMLEARVGAGNAIVEVNVDTVNEREAISERIVNPDSRIAISSDTEETTTRANDARGGSVTVASNLPDGDAGGSNQTSESNETRSREIVNYEVSETQREVLREPGAIKRVSVAVLVDGVASQSETGEQVWQQREEAELESLRALVESAIGFDAARGDSITIRSMQFDSVAGPPDPIPVGIIDRYGIDIMSLIQLAALAFVSLILGLFVVRPLLASGKGGSAAQLPAPADRGLADFPDLPALNGELDGPGIDIGDFNSPMGDLALPGGGDNPSARLRRLIEDRKEESVEVLSQWMNDHPENAR